MKKLILLALLVVIMAGCVENGYKVEKTSNVFVDIVYDDCEYVFSNSAERLAHKGNCKYCAERDSIKWEIRKAELINELKEESK